MSLPFTIAEFLDAFAAYNRAIWPAQVLLYAIGVLLAVTGYLRAGGGTRLIALGLALLWAWMGGAYHLLFFRQINFGVPCPTTIATFGLFLWITPRPPWWLLVVPLGWVLIGTSAALLLGIGEDYGLLVAGVAWLWYRLATRARTQQGQAPSIHSGGHSTRGSPC